MAYLNPRVDKWGLEGRMRGGLLGRGNGFSIKPSQR